MNADLPETQPSWLVPGARVLLIVSPTRRIEYVVCSSAHETSSTSGGKSLAW